MGVRLDGRMDGTGRKDTRHAEHPRGGQGHAFPVHVSPGPDGGPPECLQLLDQLFVQGSKLRQELCVAVSSISHRIARKSQKALTQVWIPGFTSDGVIALSCKGAPYSVSGEGDLSALFRCLSCRFLFYPTSPDPKRRGSIGRVFQSHQPEICNNVARAPKDLYHRAEAARRCLLHSLCVMPLWMPAVSKHSPVAVLEILQPDPQPDFDLLHVLAADVLLQDVKLTNITVSAPSNDILDSTTSSDTWVKSSYMNNSPVNNVSTNKDLNSPGRGSTWTAGGSKHVGEAIQHPNVIMRSYPEHILPGLNGCDSSVPEERMQMVFNGASEVDPDLLARVAACADGNGQLHSRLSNIHPSSIHPGASGSPRCAESPAVPEPKSSDSSREQNSRGRTRGVTVNVARKSATEEGKGGAATDKAIGCGSPVTAVSNQFSTSCGTGDDNQEVQGGPRAAADSVTPEFDHALSTVGDMMNHTHLRNLKRQQHSGENDKRSSHGDDPAKQAAECESGSAPPPGGVGGRVWAASMTGEGPAEQHTPGRPPSVHAHPHAPPHSAPPARGPGIPAGAPPAGIPARDGSTEYELDQLWQSVAEDDAWQKAEAGGSGGLVREGTAAALYTMLHSHHAPPGRVGPASSEAMRTKRVMEGRPKEMAMGVHPALKTASVPNLPVMDEQHGNYDYDGVVQYPVGPSHQVRPSMGPPGMGGGGVGYRGAHGMMDAGRLSMGGGPGGPMNRMGMAPPMRMGPSAGVGERDVWQLAQGGGQVSDANPNEKALRNRLNRVDGGIGRKLTFDTLKTQFGKGLKEAAESLGMCPTTLKRACRRLGVKRWPRTPEATAIVLQQVARSPPVAADDVRDEDGHLVGDCIDDFICMMDGDEIDP